MSSSLLTLPIRYTYNNQPDKAIEYNLRLRRPNAFQLIQEYNMFDAVKDKAVLLLEFDQHLLRSAENENKKPSQMPAVQMLVKNTDAIQVRQILLFCSLGMLFAYTTPYVAQQGCTAVAIA